MPKGPDQEGVRQQTDMLAGFFIDDDAPPAPVLDRSTLERWATCPRQAQRIESKKASDASLMAASGSEAHACFSQVISDYVDTNGRLEPNVLREQFEIATLGSRPDVQPDVLKATRPVVYAFAAWLSKMHPNNILRWDGGIGERSGQLAADVGDSCRVTSEIDFLSASESPALLRETDWKTGHKPWTCTDVANSFQFQMHAWLILQNYPSVQAVEIAVWATRLNERTFPVVFRREDMPKWDTRIRSAVGVWWQNRHDPEPPTWPDQDKCAICPAILDCPAAGEDLKMLISDPPLAVTTLQFLKTRAAALSKLLSAVVDKQGHDIVTEDGLCFGRDKPPSKRKPSATLYSSSGESSDE